MNEQDERGAFEQYLRDKKFPVLPVWQNGKPHQNYALEVMWDAWQARAASNSANGAQGAQPITDLATIVKAAYGNKACISERNDIPSFLSPTSADYADLKDDGAKAPEQTANVAQGAEPSAYRTLLDSLGYPWLPCPICNGTEGCDHSYPERARAALATPPAQTALTELLEDARDYVAAFTSDKEDGHIAEALLVKIDAVLTAAQPASASEGK